MNPLTLLNLIPRSLMAVVIAVLAATSCTLKYKNGEWELEVTKSKLALSQATEAHAVIVAKAEATSKLYAEDARSKEQRLVEVAANERKLKHENSTLLAAQRDAIRVRLSEAALSLNPGLTAKAATASTFGQAANRSDLPELSGASGEASHPISELLDEAERADQIRLGLLSCYKMYDEARAALAAPVPAPTP
jgi:hypothetical protein